MTTHGDAEYGAIQKAIALCFIAAKLRHKGFVASYVQSSSSLAAFCRGISTRPKKEVSTRGTRYGSAYISAYLMAYLMAPSLIGGNPAAFLKEDTKRGHKRAQTLAPPNGTPGPNPFKLLLEDHLIRYTQGHRHQRH
ncbi:hypothetical protein PENANT_c017G04529 [Penicillium antarcticum]|uniref:Uncharacterized protein n=1 Tax=Penicillium antarcticum TaxID=416450 RepID=A0A1V6Q288_9EURO|nr:hypothetical protein PENANT_c017G04529 [Penicillium antarcticum]